MDEVFVILAKANELAQPRKKRNAKNEVSDREWYINGSRWVPVFYLTINKLINPMPGQFTVMDARYNAGESCDNAPPSSPYYRVFDSALCKHHIVVNESNIAH